MQNVINYTDQKNARNILLFLFILTFFSSSFAQKSAGLNMSLCRNKFLRYPFSSSGSQFSSTKNQFNLDFSLGLALNEVMIDWMKTDFTLRFERYSGQISYFSGSPGGGSGFDVDINISRLNLGVYPIHIRKTAPIYLDVGMEGSVLLWDNVKGEFYSFQQNQGSKHTFVDTRNYRMANLFTFAVVSKISYDLKLEKKFNILPFFMHTLPLSKEFENADYSIKSMRFYVGIEFRKN